jgi:hypothetical protein
MLLASAGAHAQSYRVDWCCTGASAVEATGGGYAVRGSVGQGIAGFAKNTGLLHWIGFWSGEMPVPTVVPHLSSVKDLPNGAFISVAGKIAVSAAGEFAGFFYMEEEDRVSGIRVVAPVAEVASLARGSTINVIGKLGTSSDGERQIEGPIVIIFSTVTPPRPIMMSSRDVGGGDTNVPPMGQQGVLNGFGVNNTGLLVRAVGKVTYVDPDGEFFYLDDGCNLNDGSGYPGIRVSGEALPSLPAQDSYVIAAGMSSMHGSESGFVRMLLPRSQSDIVENP